MRIKLDDKLKNAKRNKKHNWCRQIMTITMNGAHELTSMAKYEVCPSWFPFIYSQSKTLDNLYQAILNELTYQSIRSFWLQKNDAAIRLSSWWYACFRHYWQCHVKWPVLELYINLCRVYIIAYHIRWYLSRRGRYKIGRETSSRAGIAELEAKTNLYNGNTVTEYTWFNDVKTNVIVSQLIDYRWLS